MHWSNKSFVKDREYKTAYLTHGVLIRVIGTLSHLGSSFMTVHSHV